MADDHTSLGDVSLSGQEQVRTGAYVTWQLTYTVGPLGMDDGSSLMFATSMTSDWGPPQFSSPSEPNYCSVETTGRAELTARFDPDGHVRPNKHAMVVDVDDGSLAPGEEITITIGDTSAGAPGIRGQTFPESEFVFVGLVDPFGSAEFLPVGDPLTVEIVPSAAVRLEAIARQPGTVQRDDAESLPVLVRAVDEWGNVAPTYAAHVSVRVDEGEPVQAEVTDGASVIHAPIGDATPPIRAHVEEVDGEWTATTNAVDPSNPIYWGDPHGQSGETVGTGTIEEHFSFARDIAGLDFASHAANDFQITDAFWSTIQDTVGRFHEPGNFVTLLGYEWSANTPNGGDHNVYFRGDSGEIHRSSHWQIADGPDRTRGVSSIEDLYDRFDDRDDVLVIPHHGGRRSTVEPLSEDLSPVFEMTSVWGVFEWFARELFDEGYDVGFVGGSDDHTGRPGASRPTNHRFFIINGGLTGVRAAELTRESIWKEIADRRSFATTGARIRVQTDIAGAGMGEAIDVQDESVAVEATVHGTDDIVGVDLFRDGRLVESKDLTEGADRFEVRWTGARSTDRYKVQDWDGALTLDAGTFLDPEPFGFPHPDHGLTAVTSTHLEFHGATAGNHQGIRFGIDSPEDATLSIRTPPVSQTLSLSEARNGLAIDAGPVDRNVTIGPIGRPTRRDVRVSFTADSDGDHHAYYVRVRQADGEMAWSSPTFVTHD